MMPIQYGRNPKSYPPNDNYRNNWERMFGGKKTDQRRGFGPETSGVKRVQRAVTRPATPTPDVSGASEKGDT